MLEITITANDAGRRLDRFLRKYLPGAPLGEVYRIIRKDAKVDGRRRNESYVLNEGEVLSLYLSDEALDAFGAGGRKAGGMSSAKRTFSIVYEDENVLMGVSPRGTLALLRCAKAYAYLQGRDFVTPDDIKALAVPVLSHRVVMSYVKAGESNKFIEKILSRINVPTEDYSA